MFSLDKYGFSDCEDLKKLYRSGLSRNNQSQKIIFQFHNFWMEGFLKLIDQIKNSKGTQKTQNGKRQRQTGRHVN